MRASPVLLPLVAVVPLVGAAAISIPGLFGGPLVVLVGGYAVMALFGFLPHRSVLFALGWWLLAAVVLLPGLLPAVSMPGVGVFHAPDLSGRWVWWVGAALSVGWWVVWFRRPVTEVFDDVEDDPEPDPEPGPERPRAVDLTRTHEPTLPPRTEEERTRSLTSVPMLERIVTDGDEDDADLPLRARLEKVWPVTRRSRETSATHTCDLAALLHMSEPELLRELDVAGIETTSKSAVPLFEKGAKPTGKRAVLWGSVKAPEGVR